MELFVLLLIAAVVIWSTTQKKTQPQPRPTIVIDEVRSEFCGHTYNPTKQNLEFMQALVFMAKADGQMREPERRIIAGYLIHVQPEHKEDFADYIAECVRDIEYLKSGDYKAYLNKLDKQELQSLLLWSQRVAGTQKNIHPFAEYLLEDIQARINDQQIATLNDAVAIEDIPVKFIL